MSAPSNSAVAETAPDPQAIIDAATGFMRAKHLFAAAELGVFEALAGGTRSVQDLARALGLPQRTARIIIDAVTAQGFLERQGDRYKNGPAVQAYSPATDRGICVPGFASGTGSVTVAG